MPSILDLAAELQLLIISEIHLNDIENFTLCSKHIHNLCEARLMEQYARKRSFSTIAVGHIDNLIWDEDQQIRGVHPILALRDLLAEPQSWQYTKTCVIGYMEESDDDVFNFGDQEEAALDDADLQEVVAQFKVDTRLLRKVVEVQRCFYPKRGETELSPFPSTTIWIESILSGDMEGAAFLLLAILPNLETLRFVDNFQEKWSPHFKNLTKLLRTALSEQHNTTGINFFSKLTEVGLHGLGEAQGVNHDILEGFMALPSMRKIKGRVTSGADFQRRFFQPSEVTTLEFRESNISAACFSESLRVIKGLQKFIYDFWANAAVNWNVRQLWEPRQTVRALEDYTKKTLRHLELTGRPGRQHVTVGDFEHIDFANGEPFLGSLCAFEVLETIRIETMMLYKEIKTGNPWARQQGHKLWLKQENWVPVDEKEARGPDALVEPERLVDILPESTRRLRLVGGLLKADASAMLDGLAVLKDNCLPNLTSIFFEDIERSEIDEDVVRECEDAGTKMRFWRPSA